MNINVYDLELDKNKMPFLVKIKGFNANKKQPIDNNCCYTDTNWDCLDSPKKVACFMNIFFRLDKQAEEKAYLIGITTKNRPIGVFELSHGTCNASFVSPREIFIRLVLLGAASFFLIHNHPSGNPAPSKEDSDITDKLQQASKMMDIPLMDHIIIGDNDNYFSMKQRSDSRGRG